MNEINLDFNMAKHDNANNLLHSIAHESLTFFLNHLDPNRITCILLTGSLANGEGTVVEYDSFCVTSDFDFIVFLDVQYYLMRKRYFQLLSKEISKQLRKKGIETHIVFLPTIRAFHSYSITTTPNIYQYEYAQSSICIFGSPPIFNKLKRPSKIDALELTFTVIGDLLFSEFKSHSQAEEVYIYAKRALTLLNSMLIFHERHGITYQQRLNIVKKHAYSNKFPITKEEINILECYTRFKLDGSIQNLRDSLRFKNMDDLLNFQIDFLNNFSKKLLYYELNDLSKDIKSKNMTHYLPSIDMTGQYNVYRQYLKCSKIGYANMITGMFLYLLWSLLKRKEKKELFLTFIIYKKPPKLVLNECILLSFLYGPDILKEILRKKFPWIDFNETSVLQNFFSLWQVAEESIKINL